MSLLCLLLSCVGCVSADVEVSIEKNDKASLSAKVIIEETLYNKLVEIEQTNKDAANNIAGTINLTALENFKKEP